MRNLNILLFLLLILCSGNNIVAQDIIASAQIRNISDSAYYKILLAPADKKYARQDLGNLRVFENGKTEIPYLIETGTLNSRLVQVEDFNFTKKEDTILNKTILYLDFHYPVLVSKIRIDINSPRFYKRQAKIFIVKEHEPDLISDIELYSEIKSDFETGETFVKKLRIEISNENDKPLDISAVKCYQKPTYLICNMQPSNSYQLQYKSFENAAPSYDLRFFKDKISSKLPEANIEIWTKPEQKEITSTEITIKKSDHFWQNRWFMWTCIGLGGAFVLLVAFRLLKDMDRN